MNFALLNYFVKLNKLVKATDTHKFCSSPSVSLVSTGLPLHRYH